MVYLVWRRYSTWAIPKRSFKMLNIGSNSQNMMIHMTKYPLFFSKSIWRGPAALWLKKSKRVFWHGLNSSRVLKIFTAAWPFAWHWAFPWTDTCAVILLCTPSKFDQLRSRADRFETLTWTPNFNSLEHLGSSPGPWLDHICWPGTWSVIKAVV